MTNLSSHSGWKATAVMSVSERAGGRGNKESSCKLFKKHLDSGVSGPFLTAGCDCFSVTGGYWRLFSRKGGYTERWSAQGRRGVPY